MSPTAYGSGVRAVGWVIAAVGALFLVGGMTAAPTYGLAGGVAANPGQFPFTVTLTMTGISTSTGDTYDIACSGALISPDWVITTGHCFHNVNWNRVSGAVSYPTMATFNTSTTNPAASTAISFSLEPSSSLRTLTSRSLTSAARAQRTIR
jgi:secreted trypsin-like serine protease